MEKKIEQAQAEITSRQHLQTRIRNLLSGALPQGSAPAPIKSTLYTKKFPKEPHVSLIALFDNGIDPDPNFSGPVIGKIFLDDAKQLCLALWPAEKEKKGCRKEVLLSDIKAIEFEFLVEKKAPPPHKSKALWEPSWPPEKTDLPSLVRLNIWQGIDKKHKAVPNLTFTFILPNPEPIATYWEAL